MPIKVDELPWEQQKAYRVKMVSTEGYILSERIVWCVIKQIEINDRTFILLFDHEGNDLDEAFRYLNIRKKNASYHYRYSIAKALKELYVFSFIINKKLSDFEYTDFVKLNSFLSGNANELGNVFNINSRKNGESIQKHM